jgi:diguanylate cyclase (GGDEF)-like protein
LRTAALAVFDVDFFREFNNNYGHLAGDRVLTHVARLAAETLRGDDLFFRYGGDEFVIIMPNTIRQAAFGVGEKVRQRLEAVEFKIFKKSDHVARVTVSVGVTEMLKGDDQDIFFARADQALYRAKQAGRSQVVAEPEL